MISKVKNSFSIYKNLPRSIYVLFFARTINSLGVFVYPFMTLFLTQKLGMSPGRAGFIIMLTGLAAAPGSLLGGKLADHFGRKRLLVAAEFISACSYIPCAFLGSSPLIPWFLIVGQFFMGVVHPLTTAMVTDLTVPETRKAGFSLMYLGHNLGFAVGPLVAGYLYRTHTPWIFLGDALTTFISLVLVLALVRETIPDREAIEASRLTDSPERAEDGNALKLLLARPRLLFFALMVAVIQFVYAQLSFSFPLFLSDIFGERGPSLFGSAMSLNAVIVILCTAMVISLTRNFRPAFSLTLTGLLYSLGLGVLFFLHSYVLILAAVFVLTIGEILGATNIDVYIANHTPMTHRGRFNSIFPLIMETGFFLSPVVMGNYIERLGIRSVWPLCFFLGMISVTGFFILWITERGRKHG